jgi:hypothetical protein
MSPSFLVTYLFLRRIIQNLGLIISHNDILAQMFSVSSVVGNYRLIYPISDGNN